ncbi:hypothetical protein [Hespellia stercorisuis]|uniref:Uncharacterized protein n=1 Tax=Hespellia stercorisuis DSM 15480 TaxID=1121950 RepID=A0A1M6W501_9FIRM|nr:hypothetical protein [Hespellia stercorisuis]SHK88769.1 hypothetical protein SAMN02745243_03932 [Hespellia stercorisuis DSM 15480]
MRAEFLFNKEVEGKEVYFTKAATWVDSTRNGSALSNGRCLKVELSEAEQQELLEYIMEQLMPEIKTVVKYKKKRTSLDEYKAEELEAILSMMVFEDFHKYNKAKHLADKQKKYTISAYLEHKAREAMRKMLIQERSLPVNVIRNLKYLNDAVLALAEEQEISCDEVSAEMVYEKFSDKSISYKMILSLMELYHGNISIEEMENPDECLQNNMDNPENIISDEIDEKTKNALDQVFMDFSKMELYILMKEFGFFGEQIRSMTAKELSYKDYFVSMAREDRDGEKNIEFGNVHVKHPGRNTAADDEIFVESVYYVKEKFYSNKVAKIKKKLAGLKDKVSMAEMEGCLEAYCMRLWKEKY